MPELSDALDHNRCRELMVKSALAANLWLSLNLAAQRDASDEVKALYSQIRALTVEASDLIKALGTERTDA